MQEVVDSDRIITPRKLEPKSKFGRFMNNVWNGIKTGAGKVGSWIGNSAIGKAGKWIWENKAPILGAAGGIMSGVGTITGNPILMAGGAGLSGVANAIKEGEAKKALQKVIDEREPNPYGNRYISYSDMPKIHYSPKPIVHVSKPIVQASKIKKKLKKK